MNQTITKIAALRETMLAENTWEISFEGAYEELSEGGALHADLAEQRALLKFLAEEHTSALTARDEEEQDARENY